MRTLLALALLLLPVQAWAAPVTFYGEPIFLGGGEWVTSSTVPVTPIPTQPAYMNQLVAVSGIVPYTRDIGSFPYVATWSLDGTPVQVDQRMLPEFDFGPLDDCRFGCPVIFGVVSPFDFTRYITDWAPHQVTLNLTVPNDTRNATFTILQPTPEPATMLLLGTSLAVAGWVAKRRRGR